MTTSEKVIKNKLGLLELSQQLGNVSRACKIMGYSRDSFYRSEIPLSGFCCSVNIFCGYLYYKEYQATRNSNITKEETSTIIKEER